MNAALTLALINKTNVTAWATNPLTSVQVEEGDDEEEAEVIVGKSRVSRETVAEGATSMRRATHSTSAASSEIEEAPNLVLRLLLLLPASISNAIT